MQSIDLLQRINSHVRGISLERPFALVSQPETKTWMNKTERPSSEEDPIAFTQEAASRSRRRLEKRNKLIEFFYFIVSNLLILRGMLAKLVENLEHTSPITAAIENFQHQVGGAIHVRRKTTTSINVTGRNSPDTLQRNGESTS